MSLALAAAWALADSNDRRTRPQTSISYVRSNGISQSLTFTPFPTRWPVMVLARFAEVRRCVKLGSREMVGRSEEYTSELQSPCNLVCRLLLEKKKKIEAKSVCNKMLSSIINERRQMLVCSGRC